MTSRRAHARVAWLSVLAVLALAACGGGAARTTGPTDRLTSPTVAPAGAPPPAGVELESLSFVSPALGWALGQAPCSGSVCTVLLKTSNGGTSWATVPAPAAQLGLRLVDVAASAPQLDSGCAAVACVSQVRFANARDGYVFGPALFVTTDGGRTWQRRQSDAVMALEAADDQVVRVVSPCRNTVSCDDLVQSTEAGSSSWKTLPAPRESSSELVVSGAGTLYLRGTNLAGTSAKAAFSGDDLWRSTDGGTTWQHLGDPCDSAGYGRVLAMAATGSSLALVCASGQIAPQQAGYRQGVTLSDDHGTRFGPLRALPHLSGEDGGSEPVALAMASPEVLAIADGEGGLQSSFDGGATWATTISQSHASGPEPGSLPSVTAAGVVGFQGVSGGHVITPLSTIWTTSNAGHQWRPLRFAG